MWSDVASSRGWCRRGSRFLGSSRIRAGLPARGKRVVWAAAPHLERERLCSSTEDMLHEYLVIEYLVLVLLQSWYAGTVKDYISAEVGVLGEGLLELWILFYLSFSKDSLINRLPCLLKCPPRGKNPRFLFPVMNTFSSFSTDLFQAS